MKTSRNWTLPLTRESREGWEENPYYRGSRWVLDGWAGRESETGGRFLVVALERQLRCRDPEGHSGGQEWVMGRKGYGLVLKWAWAWPPRREHAYYEGPHDCYYIGPFNFTWDPDECEECSRDR